MIYAGNDFYWDEVLSGRIPVRVVLETPPVLAFYHTRPYWPLRIVVIPKVHVSSLRDLTPTYNILLLDLLTVVQQVAHQVVTEYGVCRILTNLGRYQHSKYLHWYIGFRQAQR